MNRSRLRSFMLLYTFNYSRSHPVTPMMTSSNGNIFRVTGHLCGEFTGHLWIPSTQTPVTRSFNIFFENRLNKRLSKHSDKWVRLSKSFIPHKGAISKVYRWWGSLSTTDHRCSMLFWWWLALPREILGLISGSVSSQKKICFCVCVCLCVRER